MASPTIADAASRDAPMAKDWITKATPKSTKGAFRRKAKAAGESTKEFAEEKKDASGKTGKQARLALTLMGMGEKRKKLYDNPRS